MLVYFFRSWKRIAPPLNPRTSYRNLEEMLALRKLGYSYTVLADKYGVSKDTIRYLCRRFGLHERAVSTIVSRRDISTPRKVEIVLHDERDEPINRGKSYAEYLQEERDRRWRKLTSTS